MVPTNCVCLILAETSDGIVFSSVLDFMERCHKNKFNKLPTSEYCACTNNQISLQERACQRW